MASSQAATTFRVSEVVSQKVGCIDVSAFTPVWKVAEHTAIYNNAERILKSLPQYRENRCKEILQMSNFSLCTIPISNNGFVNTVLDAYNHHNNLILRPDDVWAAIMIQFSSYLNKHAEEFRGKFANFEGEKKLVVEGLGSLRTAPSGLIERLLIDKISKTLVDPKVKKWILPSFSTTTGSDLITVGMVFMANMKKYSGYYFASKCGLHWMTLEGSLDDWKEIHRRLKKLKEYNLHKWYDMLEPILKQFINAKQGNADIKFWQRMVHHCQRGTHISGWITAFCMFDEHGNWQRPNVFDRSGLFKHPGQWPRISLRNIPTGVVEVDVTIVGYGSEYQSVLFGGHMGAEVKNRGDTLQPSLGWAIALKDPKEKQDDE